MKKLQFEIECDSKFCGEKCPYNNYSANCMLFNRDRIASEIMRNLGLYLRLEICRKSEVKEDV